jgi:hypothetical protein
MLMTLSTLMEAILGKQQKRQEARASDFPPIVVQIADGNEPETDHVERVLHEAGKTLDDLKKPVELLQQRRDLRQKLDSVPCLTAKRREQEKQIAEADAELDAAEQRHANLVMPLRADLDDLKQETFAGDQARGELQRTCPDPDLLTRLGALAIPVL